MNPRSMTSSKPEKVTDGLWVLATKFLVTRGGSSSAPTERLTLKEGGGGEWALGVGWTVE